MLERLEPRILLSSVVAPPALLGDMNHDGYVDASDAGIIAEYVVRLHGWPIAPDVVARADISGDGKVNSWDVSIALSLGAGFSFPGLAATIYDGHTASALDGTLNVFAPTPTDTGAYWTVPPSLANLWGPTGRPDLNAIHQGPTADCYLLASLAGMTLTHPDDLMRRITLDGTGFCVEFNSQYHYGLANSGHVIVHVDARFSQGLQVNNGAGVWWEVIEKAYAWFRQWDTQNTPANTFMSIGWGDASVPYAQMGWSNFSTYTGGWGEKKFTDYIVAEMALGYAVVYQTANNAPTQTQSHVMLILSVNPTAGTAMVFNPWGFTFTCTIQDIMLNDINWLTIGE